MVATISPTTLADLRRKGEKVTLIDVRTPAEYGEVHVDLAHNIPLDRLDAQTVAAVAGHGPVYFVCKSGNRSQKACSSAACPRRCSPRSCPRTRASPPPVSPASAARKPPRCSSPSAMTLGRSSPATSSS